MEKVFRVDEDATISLMLSLYERTRETCLVSAIDKALAIDDENDVVYQNACFLKVALPFNQHLPSVYNQITQRIQKMR